MVGLSVKFICKYNKMPIFKGLQGAYKNENAEIFIF
jgi:hypothetical protein